MKRNHPLQHPVFNDLLFAASFSVLSGLLTHCLTASFLGELLLYDPPSKDLETPFACFNVAVECLDRDADLPSGGADFLVGMPLGEISTPSTEHRLPVHKTDDFRLSSTTFNLSWNFS